MSRVVDATGLDVFLAERARLTGLAYRMLGSLADAEDAVQEGWLRWQGLDDAARAAIERPAAWLTTTVSRLALDRLKSAQRRREEYVGPWLPEPVLQSPDPAESAELSETLTLGFLTVLERLGPVERAVFLLVDVFGEPFADVAVVVGRSEEACRQLASRARRRVRDEHRKLASPPADATGLVHAFLQACAGSDLDGLHRLLTDDVVLFSDGGKLVHAARRPVIGFDRVARLLTNLSRRLPESAIPEVRTINGEPGFVLWWDGRAALVVGLEVDDEQVRTIRIINNPDKLRHLVA